MVLYFECFGFIAHVFWNFDSRDSHCASATDAGENGIGIFSSLSAFCFFVSAFFSYTFPSAEIFNFGEYPRPENHRQKFLLKEGLGIYIYIRSGVGLFVCQRAKAISKISRAISKISRATSKISTAIPKISTATFNIYRATSKISKVRSQTFKNLSKTILSHLQKNIQLFPN